MFYRQEAGRGLRLFFVVLSADCTLSRVTSRIVMGSPRLMESRRATEDTEDTEVYTEKSKKEEKLNFPSVPISVSSVSSVAPPDHYITKSRCSVICTPPL